MSHSGPTWRRKRGGWDLPKRTLGLQVLGWTADYLLQPDGPDAGEPWRFTDEQARWVLWWYAVDGQGRFVYRYGMLRRMKGWGKDPQAAALACVETLGPCRFAGWADGEPLAASHPAAWVQIAAVSRDQTRNTMTLFPGMISKRAIEEYGVDIGKEIIYAHKGRCRIEAVTSSPRALEGGRATFTIKNETEHWLAPNEGHQMAAVIARNAAKSRDGSSRVLAIANAHAPGENSDAEHDYEAWKLIEAGQAPADMMYDSLEAPANTDLDDDESTIKGLSTARGDSHWVDTTRLLAEIRDPRTPRAVAARFYLNLLADDIDRPFDRARFDELAAPRAVPAKAWITLGFDGSLSRDHTVLIGTEVETGYQWVVGYWEPQELANGERQINMAEVDQTVDYAFETWRVWRLNGDPSKWSIYMARWAEKHGEDKIVAWPTAQYRKMANAHVAYRDAIQTGELSHDGEPRFAAAIGNAHKHTMHFRDDKGERMWILQKERPDSPLKIDAAIAGTLSWQGRIAAVASGVTNEKEVVWATV